METKNQSWTITRETWELLAAKNEKREKERQRERDANREEHHSLTGDRTELDQNGYKKKQRGQDRKAF